MDETFFQILPPFQIIGRFGSFRFIDFAPHIAFATPLYIHYVQIRSETM